MRLIFVVLISLMVFANDGPVYYVDTASGNDSNPGTLFAPWKTIQRAAYTAEGGSIVHVRSGVYDERVFLTISGSPGALVTFQADGTVVTKGFTIYADYVRVIGFEITNPTISFTDGTGIFVQGRLNEILNNYIHDLLFAEGIWLYGGPTHDSPSTGYNTVAGNRIVRARISGILIEGTGNYIDSNDISHTIQNPPGAPPRAGADADGMRFFGHGHLVRRNSIHDIWLSDIGNVDPHIDCFQTWGPASDITFEQNRCLNSNDVMQGWMISMLSPDAPISNIMIRNNVMKAFRIANVWGASGVTIVNNSFKSELFYTGPSAYGIELHSSPNAVVQNNLFLDIGRNTYPYITIDNSPGATVSNNAVYMTNGQPPAGFPMPNDAWQVDPKLTDVSSNDFRPTSSSPLIDAGMTLPAVSNDYSGVARPQGHYDIGAYQFPRP